MSSRVLSTGQSCRISRNMPVRGIGCGTFSLYRHMNVYSGQHRGGIVGSRHSWTCLAQPDMEEARTEFEELHGESFWDVLGEQAKNQLNVVICYTSKCMPCKLAKPIMAEWEEDLAQGQGKQVKMFQFALTMPNKDCALAMDVRSSPTFLVIRDGEIVSRGKGKAALDDIKAYVYAHA